MIRNLLFPERRQSAGRGAVILFTLLILLFAFLLGSMNLANAQEPLEPADIPDAHAGLPLFADRCINCHGPEGKGDGEMAGNLPKPPRDFSDEEFRRTAVPSLMFQTITDGILEGGMPPFGPSSSNAIEAADRWDLVAAVYSLGTPVEALEEGRVVYEEYCLACHGENGDGNGPEAADSTATPTDLTDLRYWYNRSNEMVLADLQNNEIADHTYSLETNELWDATDYARSFSYVYADPEAAAQPIASVSVAGQIMNGTTDELITDGAVTLRAFTPDLQEAATLTTAVGPNGRYVFEVSDAGPDWVYMASIDHGDLNFSSNPERLDVSDPQLEMPIVVFDTTDDPSAININQVHMIMDYANDRVQFSEIYVLSNLEPAVFVGESGVSDEGTLQFALPAGAENVEFQRSFRSFENFLPASEVIPTEQGYADTIPIRPGDGAMNLLVSYDLPFEEGMTIEHPVFYDTGNATIVVPDIGLTIEGDEWVSEGPQQMGNAGSISSYSRPALAAGEAISFSLEGRPEAPARVGGDVSTGDDTMGILIGGAVLLLVAGGAAYTLNGWRTDAQDAAADQANQVDRLLYAVAGLDEAYDAGNLEESVYQERRVELMKQLAAVWDSAE